METIKPPQKNICLVAIIKNENSFIDEWLIYHSMIGIDHFYLYDNDQMGNLKDFLLPHLSDITVINWKQSKDIGNQLAAYNHALNNYILKYEWVIFLDVDEFIVLKDHTSIQSFLSQFTTANAVSLNWHLFGHNGYLNNPDGLITSALTRRMYQSSPEVKSFTRTMFISEIKYPHYCELKQGIRVDANGFEFTEKLYADKSKTAHINHYQSRSFSNWMDRSKRGDVNFNKNNLPIEHTWRLNEELLMNLFVTSIARNKNEFVDKYMTKYQYDIYEKINKLNRLPNPLALEQGEYDLRENINAQLEEIARILTEAIPAIKDIGLYNGLSGITLFFFSYGNYKKNDSLINIGQSLIDIIVESIDKTTKINYAHGIAGFGVLIEYLVKKSFIKTDTDDVLEDIDDMINYHLIQGSITSVNMDEGLAGLGKYYVYRIRNHFNDEYGDRKNRNKKILNDIIDLLETPFATYTDLIAVIHFLTCAYHFSVDKIKVTDYLNYAIDKIETMRHEDRHFNIQNNEFNILKTKLTIIAAYKTIHPNKLWYDNLNILTNTGQQSVWFDNVSLDSGLAEKWCLYKKLFIETRDQQDNSLSIAALRSILKHNSIYLKTLDTKQAIGGNMGLETGLAGIGMSILAAVDNYTPDWSDLLGL